MIMTSLFKVHLWSQVVLPFNREDLVVLFASSSLVHLALHVVAHGPEDSAEHSQEAEHNQHVGRDDPPNEPVRRLHGHQVGPGADHRKSHTRQDHAGQGPQLLLHIHDRLTHLFSSLALLFFPLMETGSFTSLVTPGSGRRYLRSLVV